MQINGDERRFAATHLLALRHKNDHTIASSVIWGFSFSLFFPSIKARTLFFFPIHPDAQWFKTTKNWDL